LTKKRREAAEEGRSCGPVLFWIGPSDRLEEAAEGLLLHPGGDLSLHLFRSLRAREGDRFVFVDPDASGERFSGRVERLSPPLLSLVRLPSELPVREPAFDLAVALLKGEGWEDLIEPLAILGARRLVPLLAERSQLRWSSEVFARKRERFTSKVREASQLAGRADRMEIASPVGLHGFLSDLGPSDRILFYDPDPLSRTTAEILPLAGEGPLVATIGPEGGWSERERALFLEIEKEGRGFRASLGPRILPGRLAPLVVASLLSQAVGSTHSYGETKQ